MTSPPGAVAAHAGAPAIVAPPMPVPPAPAASPSTRKHLPTRPARRNQSRLRARQALRIARKRELDARSANPKNRKLVRQQVYHSFFHQLFAATRPRR
jgi:hypothetical protein